jgi:hypothetical protein
LILAYSKVRSNLLAEGVTLVMVSIGKHEIGQKLVEHLDLNNGDEFLFVGKYSSDGVFDF